MDPNTKMVIAGELSSIKGLLSSVNSQANGLNNAAFPVVGTTVILPSLPMAAIAIRTQNDCIEKLIKIIEKLVNEM